MYWGERRDSVGVWCSKVLLLSESMRWPEMDRWRLIEEVPSKGGEVERTNLSEMDR